MHSRQEHGFTLVELLIVFVILAILIAIAVPSYLHVSARAEKRSAAADVRESVPDAEAYHVDNDTYAGMTITALRGYDTGMAIDDVEISPDGNTYCLDKTVDSQYAYVIRGNAPHTPADPGSVAGQVDETGLCPATIDDTSN
jgi:prepilin-type N-terminal cleavage/methylation domain-containing protein